MSSCKNHDMDVSSPSCNIWINCLISSKTMCCKRKWGNMPAKLAFMFLLNMVLDARSITTTSNSIKSCFEIPTIFDHHSSHLLADSSAV
eukprot:1444280-Ditylum_brightwellii.AAC.1